MSRGWNQRNKVIKSINDVGLSAEQAKAEGVPLNREQRRVLKKGRS
ncbi:MAG TPA: hypothetical protein VHK27_06075 [Gammaproteobacteria bacterium]|nr:hypothetical protein [Gammaproteobacteria bacterium]